MKTHVFFLLIVGLGRPTLLPAQAQPVSRVSIFDSVRHSIREGDTPSVRRLLRDDPRIVHFRDEQDNTLLMWAAFQGNTESVRLLLEHGAEVNATNRVGATPLMRAATDHDKVVLLGRAGADVNARSALGNTPLLLAARRYGSAPTVRWLIAEGADVNARNRYGNTALMAAAAAGDFESVRILVARGADVNAAPDLSYPGDPIWGGMRTPLMWAALRGDTRIAGYLLEHGADIEAGSGFGTPLSQAVWGESRAMVRFLLDRGAPVDQAIPMTEYTPLHWAASSDRTTADLIQLLLERGADPNAEGGRPVDAFMGVPQTPLRLARHRGTTPVVEALLRAGAKEVSEGNGVASLSPVTRKIGNSRSVRAALTQAVMPLQRSAAVSRESFLRHGSRQNCLSCHQQYLPMAAVGLARQRSIPIDRDAAAAQLELGLVFHGDQELNHEALFHPEPAIGHGYALLGLSGENQEPGVLSDIMVHHLAVIQNEDGSWTLNIPRPPIQSSKVTGTALSVHALTRFGWPARRKEFERAVASARRWLWKAEPAFHEERVFQLLGLAWAGESPRKLRHLAQALIGEQREDGGWAQGPGLSADAYATGQALYALQQAAAIGSDDPGIRRGMDFLLRAQGSDGTWHVRRRAFPFQPTMDSGFPHGRDSWISAMATSWAVLALAPAAESVAPVAQGGNPSEITAEAAEAIKLAAAAPDAALPAASDLGSIDFVRDIRPILERSCFACHSGDKAKSRYRLETREDLLATGNQGEPAVRAGQGAASPLVHYIAGAVPDMEMPPMGKRAKFPALSSEEIGLVRAWIDRGAPWPADVRLTAAPAR